MKPEALERISIRWLPDPTYEDTKTIALNVGGYFMDLRVTKDTPSIEWAQAGERTILKEDPRMYSSSRSHAEVAISLTIS